MSDEVFQNLNHNQVLHRVKQIPAWIKSLDGKTLKALLVAGELWQRMVDDGLIDGVASAVEDLTLEQKREKMLDGLFRRGVAGDAQAARAFQDLASQSAKKRAFDVTVYIRPYRIKDASLRRIVMDADEKPVHEILEAWAERCRIDECPAPIIERAEQLLRDWKSWAEVAYRDAPDREVIPDAEELTEESVDKLLEEMIVLKSAAASGVPVG